MEVNLWGPNWRGAEKKEVATLTYGTVVVRIPYTFIHHLNNVLPGATRKSHLRDFDDRFLEALEEIEKQMGKSFGPRRRNDSLL